jgi:hypothetical protein
MIHDMTSAIFIHTNSTYFSEFGARIAISVNVAAAASTYCPEDNPFHAKYDPKSAIGTAIVSPNFLSFADELTVFF